MDCNNTIYYINVQIEKLYALSNKYGKLQSDFEARQRKRVSQLNNFNNVKISVKLAKAYYESMKSLLNGTNYRNTVNGLKAAQDQIMKKINSLKRELNDNRNILQYRTQRIQYWKEQLQYTQD